MSRPLSSNQLTLLLSIGLLPHLSKALISEPDASNTKLADDALAAYLRRCARISRPVNSIYTHEHQRPDAAYILSRMLCIYAYPACQQLAALDGTRIVVIAMMTSTTCFWSSNMLMLPCRMYGA